MNLSHWLVYSSSSLAEQTTPAFVEIIDHNATVGTIDFVGTDLNMDVPWKLLVALLEVVS